nr:hypothetical protein [Tanacetum cinerariifolium]
MEMIVMDEHNTKMHATMQMDKLKRFQHHLKEGNAFIIQSYSLGEIKPKFRMRPFKSITDLEKEEDNQFDVVGQVIACGELDNYDKNGKAGKNIYTHYEGNEIKCTLWGDYFQQFNDFLNFYDDHGRIVSNETGTMSLSLFNDEVRAMVGRSTYQLCEKYAKSESDGSILTEITNLIGNKYAFKVAIDDYNVKNLLPVFYTN